MSLMQQVVVKAKELKLTEVFGLGDFFESRNEQPLFNLKTFEQILNLFHKNGITLIAIPGNHDKVNYKSSESYLDAYGHHPGIALFKDPVVMDIGGKDVLLIPFYSDEVWVEKVTPYLTRNNTVLLSHIAVEGSVNNDGSSVESRINPSLLKGFDLVLLGHYHNQHRVSNNIIHLHSTHQNNHGEDDFKGFTILNDDLSIEHVQAEFRRFVTVNINTDDLTNTQTIKAVENAKSQQREGVQVRVNFLGKKESIPTSVISMVKQSGMDVKVFHPDIESSIEEAESGDVVEFDASSILEEFEKFCKKENILDKQRGLNYLKKKMNGHR